MLTSKEENDANVSYDSRHARNNLGAVAIAKTIDPAERSKKICAGANRVNGISYKCSRGEESAFIIEGLFHSRCIYIYQKVQKVASWIVARSAFGPPGP